MSKIAHSSDSKKGVTEQPYLEHACNVRNGISTRASKMLQYQSDSRLASTLQSIADTAGEYHDLGKLADGFQTFLKTNGRDKRQHIRHEDAGVYALAKHGHLEAALLTSSHHHGIDNIHFTDDDIDPNWLRVEGSKNKTTKPDTEANWERYLSEHSSLLKSTLKQQEDEEPLEETLTRRLLLSCLVDADHSDTAAHYNDLPETHPCEPRWNERLDALNNYISDLEKNCVSEKDDNVKSRNQNRSDFYQSCMKKKSLAPLLACDAPVGSGKTTAIMAHLLKVAHENKLRHIFVILPFTNIINQSVETYRKVLTLKGENPNEVVSAHHHQVAFKDLSLRHLTTLWQTPIIVTTAVQFFETLASNHTGKLRKLHELPGSAIFVDEAHAVLPAKFLPLAWQWMQNLTQNWACRIVLASGSLARYWELESFREIIDPVDHSNFKIENLEDSQTRALLHQDETKRVSIITESFSSGDALIERILSVPGPRIVVLNTVHAAAMLAHKMRQNGHQTLHLSTALTPNHRKIIIERIKENLKYQTDWTLVATSLVEAGMDFSFKNGFRQRASTTSLIQLGGRVNRNSEQTDSQLFDFTLTDDDYPTNPTLKSSIQALEILMKKGVFSEESWDLQKICTTALDLEFKQKLKDEARALIESEEVAEYKTVAENFKIIEADTRFVVIDPTTIQRLENYEKVSSQELIHNSIQLWMYKITQLALEPIRNSQSKELYKLPQGHRYDPDFLGYMEETVRMKNYRITDGYLI